MNDSTRVHAPALDTASARARLRLHGKSFAFAGRFLSPTHLDDAACLYAFCRALDDGVDHAANSEQARHYLGQVETELRRGTSSQPDVQAFLDLAERKQIDLDVVYQLIAGQHSDLDTVRMRDDAALKRYSYQVAGTVGILMCHALDAADRQAYLFAIDLGIGMQLTNIVRDIREDAAADRIYLPATLIGDRDPDWIDQQCLEHGAALQQAVQTLLAEADRYYQSGESGLAFLPPRARFAIFVAARLYHAIGQRIQARQHHVGPHRTIIPWPRKLAIAAASLRTYRAHQYYRERPTTHDATLHHGFAGLPGAESQPVGVA
jgi:phytoene synthase